MLHVCLEAEEMRVFIKQGKLWLQVRKKLDGKVTEQVMISFPPEMACYFTQVTNLDIPQNLGGGIAEPLNRLDRLFNED